MTAVPDRVRRLAATAGWIALLIPLVVVLLSVALSPESNWTVRTFLAAFIALAVLQPAAALLVTAALLGFGTILAHMAGVPTLRVTELLVVASLAGCCVRALAPRGRYRVLSREISIPVALFGIAVTTSTIVWLKVQQVETGYPSEFFLLLVQFFSRHYFVQADEFLAVVSAAVILEGLALYVVVKSLCRADATFFARGLRMLILGGAGLALTSAIRLAEIYLSNPEAIEALRDTPNGLRISAQIPDFIAAGSYFGLCWVATLGLAIAATRRKVIWLGVSVPLLAALYLTGSRSVIAAALVGLVVMVAVLIRQRIAALRGIVAFAIVAVAVMVMGYPWWTGRDVSGVMAKQSLHVRAELMKTGVRVLETRPVFGVGIDRFHQLAGGLASPDLNALFPGRKNPHNDFLRFAAELGAVGLGIFLWILAAAGARIRRGLERTRDARLAGLVGGLAAFLVTSMVSNPMMVREVSYLFWIALGLAVGGAAESFSEPRRISRSMSATAAVIGGLLIFSVPLRSTQELSGVDLTRISYGLFDWGTDADGTRSRWSRPEFTLFVDGRARVVEIPLSGIPLRANVVRQVEVRVDGRLVDRVPVGPEWTRVRTALPDGPREESYRLDFVVSPSWIPAEEIEGSEDTRVLGVKVGELNVLMPAGAQARSR